MLRDPQIIQRAIDDALRLWHRWASAGRPVEGYPTECPSCRMSKASRRQESQYDDAESDHANDLAALIDQIIGRMQDPYRTALHLNARNIATGHYVWVSARLPEDRQERAAIVGKARDMFAVAMGDML